MITEIALLNIIPGKAQDFEKAFGKAQEIISSMKGYIKHELQKCMEDENKYLLLIRWETIGDHTEGFRKHERYNEWKNLLHHFYHPFPVVEHYKTIY
ncbi:MAG: antibiotic biosynthesis monooxygenase [Sphingobacteriales bacterium]|nr:MAG: antibiotic biosynthesis monooxygenase [Sphingobacteriales bacterium]